MKSIYVSMPFHLSDLLEAAVAWFELKVLNNQYILFYASFLTPEEETIKFWKMLWETHDYNLFKMLGLKFEIAGSIHNFISFPRDF